MKSADCPPDDINEKIKNIRQDIKQVYVQMTIDAMKKAEQEPAMMEDVDGWVEPVIKKIKH